jgi:hypothetical protein
MFILEVLLKENEESEKRNWQSDAMLLNSDCSVIGSIDGSKARQIVLMA